MRLPIIFWYGGSRMLPAYIIEEIRNREQQERRRQQEQRPQIELPLPTRKSEPPKKPSDRGVTIIDLMGDS